MNCGSDLKSLTDAQVLKMDKAKLTQLKACFVDALVKVYNYCQYDSI